jgi:hypothetical protein
MEQWRRGVRRRDLRVEHGSDGSMGDYDYEIFFLNSAFRHTTTSPNSRTTRYMPAKGFVRCFQMPNSRNHELEAPTFENLPLRCIYYLRLKPRLPSATPSGQEVRNEQLGEGQLHQVQEDVGRRVNPQLFTRDPLRGYQ